MRIVTWAMPLALGIGVADGAHAQTRPGFEIGVEAFDYDYRERDGGDAIANDDGVFGGVTGSYVETLGGGLFLRARLAGATGSVDYSSPISGNIKNVSQSVGQVELQLGRDFPLGAGGSVTPFIGLGTRLLDDESGGEESDSGNLGYDREISYHYLPIGVAAEVPMGKSGTMLMLSVQYDWVVDGRARSLFSDIDPDLPNVVLDLDGGHGLEVSARASFEIGSHRINIGPFVRHWNIDQSDSLTITEPEGTIELTEPRNKTSEWGLRLSFAF